jgi:CheY-like chemotaxis protein
MSNALVFIIEDDAGISNLYRFFVQRLGLRAEVFLSGHEAFERIQREPPPDLIILDLHLPQVSGTQIYETVRQEPRCAHTRIIVSSADVQAASDYGGRADAVLVKPIEWSEFPTLVMNLATN